MKQKSTASYSTHRLKLPVDLERIIKISDPVYAFNLDIDGTKLKSNAGNYTWVWKKSCIKNRNKVFAKITELGYPFD